MIGVPIPLVPVVQMAKVNSLPKRLTAPSRSFLNGLLDNQREVRGAVLLSQRLHWWLRSFGSNVEVLAPVDLREKLVHEARELAAMYDGAAG